MNNRRIYFLSKEQIENGVRVCEKKVKQILSDVEILCNNGGDETSAVFLYTIAIEEFGKLLLLKKSLHNPAERKGIPVSINLFQGVSGHSIKIDEAMETLPEECQIYQNVDMFSEAYKIPIEHRQIARNIPKMQEELRKLHEQFPYARFDMGDFALPFDFAVRKSLLYVNWDPEHKRWNEDVTIYPYKIIEDEDGDEKEVEKNEDEIYPEKLLIAIDLFRDCLNEKIN